MTKFIAKTWLTFSKITLLICLVFANLSFAFAADPVPSGNNAPAGTEGTYHSFDLKTLNLGETTSNNGLVKGGQSSEYLKSTNPLASFILQIINFITIISGSLAFLGVVVGGFLMLSSAGNENQITKGKDIVTRALLGLVITLCAYFVVAFVQSLLFETPK